MLDYECFMIMLMLCESSYARLTPEVLHGRCGHGKRRRPCETDMHVTRGAGAGVRALASPRFLETFTNHCLRLLIYVLLAIAYAATFSKLTRVH